MEKKKSNEYGHEQNVTGNIDRPKEMSQPMQKEPHAHHVM